MIGEAMAARVIPAAQRIGAEWYDPGPSTGDLEQDLEANRAWIRRMMAEDRVIFDAGPQPGRRLYRKATSPFYAMELEELRGYPKLVRLEV